MVPMFCSFSAKRENVAKLLLCPELSWDFCWTCIYFQLFCFSSTFILTNQNKTSQRMVKASNFGEPLFMFGKVMDFLRFLQKTIVFNWNGEKPGYRYWKIKLFCCVLQKICKVPADWVDEEASGRTREAV